MSLRFALPLLLLSAPAAAGVSYLMSTRGAASTSAYFVEGERVRINASDGKTVYIFRDQSITVIDTAARSGQLLRRATLEESERQLDESLQRMQTLAASAPPEQKAMADQGVATILHIRENNRRAIPRDYRRTDRTEASDGRPCRVWEEWEGGAKRLELCVVPASALPGGAQAWAGFKAMSAYLHGAVFALGIEVGPHSLWPGIEQLGGVPVLIREFKDGRVLGESQLTGFRAEAIPESQFEAPAGYAIHEGPGQRPGAPQ